MEHFLLPSKVVFEEDAGGKSGTVTITPCFHGYGTTLGNAFRRVLLSSLPGSAVEYFKIKGVQHEFSTVEGVQEDAVELMLNLKQLAAKIFTDEIVELRLTKKGPGPVTAGDITPDSRVEIINKDLVIANLTNTKTLDMEIGLGQGKGYKPTEEKNKQNYDLGTVVTDSVYTPICDVGYKVEFTRVGDITNYEKLTINIETNGTITPREAVRQSAEILTNHLNIILEEAGKESIEMPSMAAAESTEETVEESGGADDGDGGEEKKEKSKKISKKK